MMTSIPVVDFDGVFSSTDLGSCPQVEQIHSAFTTVGFVFIKNHGIPRKQIDDAFELSASFFSMPLEVKMKYAYDRSKEENTGNDGYRSFKQESLDPTGPAHGDLKECFDICDFSTCNYPDELPEFKHTMIKIYDGFLSFAQKFLEIMGYALKLKDPQYFLKVHQKMGHGSKESYTDLRVLYYPPLPSTSEIKPGQLRCGEHIDYSSLSLLFQDPTGGLQVKRTDGEYIDVPYRPDAVLVNLGIQMQHWTNDIYFAAPHRVLLPESEEKRRKARQCIAFFTHADNDVLLKCIDGSNEYPSITAKEDTDRRLNTAMRQED